MDKNLIPKMRSNHISRKKRNPIIGSLMPEMERRPKSKSNTDQPTPGRPILQEIKMMHSERQIIKDHSKVEINRDILKDEIPSANLHHIHPSIQTHFMVIVIQVLTMDTELWIAGDIPEVLREGFIKALEADLLEDKTKSHMPMTTKVTIALLLY